MARNKGPIGVVDTKDFPRGKPSGITNAMNIAAPLESGADISQSFGPQKENPPRGTRVPSLGPHRKR